MSTITNRPVRLSTNFTNDSCRFHTDRLRRLIAATLCCLLLAPRVAGQTSSAHPEDVGLSSDTLARIKPALQDLVDRQQVSGVITLIARKGKVVYADSVGMQDIETNVPMRRDTICRFYSMSKPITSVAVMMLYEEGKLRLDDPVSKFLPEFAGLKVFVKANGNELDVEDPRREMTIADLLRHTSGLTYGVFGATPVDQRYMAANVLSPDGTLADMVHKLSGLPLLYQPGTRFNYSVSADVLGRVVEVVSGKPFDAFLAERIFQPLGMVDTTFYVPAEKLDRFATNYGPKNGGGLQAIDPSQTSRFRLPPKLLSGGGGLVSTAPDYMRFCLMLLNGGGLDGKRLLRPETVKLMTENHLPIEAYPIEVAGFRREGVGFGYGFSVVVDRIEAAPYVPIGEYGWGGAASTHFWISPKHELAVVVLTQYMPFSSRLESAVKPLVYEAINH
jgi:CubicO group peptidase (beta-lactamase class C family)